jgi:excisionase family DNA binding protein
MTGPLFKILTTADVAAAAGVSRATVRRWVRSGRLHRVQDFRGPRGQWVFRPDEVDDLLLTLGKIRPAYRTGDIMDHADGDLVQIITFRPSSGYLIRRGEGRFEWVPEASLTPARPT